jgi:hypothetical protein
MARRGAKGCVINHIKTDYSCPGISLDKEYITKIEQKEFSETEIEIYKKIDERVGKQNGDNKYYIGHPILCVPGTSEEITRKEEIASNKDNCNRKISLENEDFIDYENGGVSLKYMLNYEKIKRDSDFYIKLFTGFSNILKAVNLLNTHNIYHFDIKPDNIVGDMTKGLPTLRLIDLGDSKVIDNLIDYLKSYDSVGTAGFLAPEKIGSYPFFLATFVNPELIGYDNDIKRMKLILTGEEGYTSNEYAERKNDTSKPLWFSKIDVWSVGATLYAILQQLEQDIKLKPDDYTDLNKAVDISNVKSVMLDMLKINLDERPNAEEALNKYLKSFKSIGGRIKRRLSRRRNTKRSRNRNTKRRRIYNK